MKLRNWTSIAIFISSYAPLSIILLIQDIDLKTCKLQNPVIVFSVLGISLLSVLALIIAMNSIRQGDIVTLTRVSNRSGDLVSYTVPYMITFFAFKISDYQAFLCFLIFMALMCFLTIRTQHTFINPLLALQYSLYEVEFERGSEHCEAVVLSKVKICKGQKCQLRQIADFLYCMTNEKPNV